MSPAPPSSATLSAVEPASKDGVEDRFGRRLRYLRVSVTDLCNLSCTYCNPVQGCAVTHPYKLSWEDLDFLVDVAVNDLGVEALRITGGEPTVRPGLENWIAGIRRFDGLRDVAMTTNGIRLARIAEDLRAAGLNRVNISLDTFDAGQYGELTRGGSLDRCMEGIHVAREVFDRTKINTVLLKGINFEQLPAFAEFSGQHNIEVRFIELMPIWEEKDYFYEHFVSVDDAIALLKEKGVELVEEDDTGPAERNATGYGPATTWRVRDSRARLGFISQMSHTKCLSCNKLRLTSDGALKPCLLSPAEVDLAPLVARRDRGAVVREMRNQFLSRAEKYDALQALTDPFHRSMQAIGG